MAVKKRKGLPAPEPPVVEPLVVAGTVEPDTSHLEQIDPNTLAAALQADLTDKFPDAQPAPAWTELNPLLAFEAGKSSIQLDRTAAVEILLVEQKAIYERAGRADLQLLVQACLDRDRIIAQMGREIAEGKIGGRMLREFVRAALASADRAADPQKLQDFLEKALGAEPADRRQLKLKGTTL